MRMDQEPDLGDPPLDPPTREEEEADAWEHWHQRARELEADVARLQGVLGELGANRYWEGRWRDEKKENDRLRVELTAARDALRNDFEPDNQSRAWHRANKALDEAPT